MTMTIPPRKRSISYMVDPKLTSEDKEQTIVVTYLEKRGLLVFAIPNAGKRKMTDAMRQKRMGLRAGVPDLFIPMARDHYHGLFIEMKRKDNYKVSDHQLYWRDILSAQGYRVEICCGSEEAIRVIDEYFGYR